MDDTLIHCGHRVRFVFFEAQWDIIVGRLETGEEREPPRRDRCSAATLRDNSGFGDLG